MSPNGAPGGPAGAAAAEGEQLLARLADGPDDAMDGLPEARAS